MARTIGNAMFSFFSSLFRRSRIPKPDHRIRKLQRSRLISRIFLLPVLILALAGPLDPGLAAPHWQTLTPEGKARVLLDQLTPEERVGQLFLVTFNGTDVSTTSQIYDLVNNFYVGGVMLQAANDNFTTGNQSLEKILEMTRQLQRDSWDASQQTRLDLSGEKNFTPAFIPLFIGISQEGDGYPYDQILNGVTELPNEMAIGATWDPNLATQVGSVMGKELSNLGFNLFFGPSLDVLENPHIEGSNDLGTRTFGGDPFWVGKMGSAYIKGVHQGSDGHMAVVSTHFPGYGGSDRLPEEEVATVPKSLDQLKRFDLVPFYAVTGDSTSPETTSDALLASHIRYQGFQGSNIRATTRPFSFDPQVYNQLMALPQLDSWHKNGGVMISDNLGSRAIRRYYELTNQDFNMPRRVALNAFLAGNDLLYVADFSSGDLDSYTAAQQTLEFFAQKYRQDTAFAQRVDISVLRILTLKYRLYTDFSLNQVLPSANLADIGKSDVTFSVARQAATLISPSQADLANEIPDAPNRNNRIVFITDSRMAQQCSKCVPQPLMDVKALEQVVLRRYGPQAGGSVTPNYLSSYSLDDVQNMLNAGRGDSDIERDLRQANWVIFSMLNANNNVASYQTLGRFLAERTDLFQQKRLIVFAFGAPYYLDATNITKLTAYYALYSKAPQFVEMAAYLLFQELPAKGSLPVSVPGVGYDLNVALFPDPGRVIPLLLDINGSTENESNGTTAPAPVPTPDFRVGDQIPVSTGIILDHNGNPVPDGTQVDFILSMGSEADTVTQPETTVNGVAHTTFTVTNSGTLEIRAQSELAKSDVLKFDIPAPGGTSSPSTPTETPTPTPSPTPTATLTPQPEGVLPIEPPARPQFSDWLMAVLVTLAIAWSAYRLAAQIGQVRWGVRAGFLALIGGLLAYSYLALEMPGSESLLHGSVPRSVFLVTLSGAAIGLIITLTWRMIKSPADNNDQKDMRT